MAITYRSSFGYRAPGTTYRGLVLAGQAGRGWTVRAQGRRYRVGAAHIDWRAASRRGRGRV